MILEVCEEDLLCEDYLTLEATSRFIEGGYTHIRCDGCTTEVFIIKRRGLSLARIGKEVVL